VYVCDFESPTHPVRAGGARITPHTHTFRIGKGSSYARFSSFIFFEGGGRSKSFVCERDHCMHGTVMIIS
jgi:hypothetical protein